MNIGNMNLKLALLAAAGFAGVLIQPIAVRVLWVILMIGASALTLLASWKALRERSA